MGFPHSSVGKESACNAGDPGSIPRSGRSPGDGNGNPIQYSCLENPMNRGAWQATVHGVARVRHDLVTKPPPQAGHILLKRLQKILLISCYVPQPPLPPKFSRGHTVCVYWWEHVYEYVWVIFSTYLWIFQLFSFFWFSFILLWLEKSVGMISIFLGLLKLVIYPEECPVCVEECILLHLHGMFSRCLSSTFCLW